MSWNYRVTHNIKHDFYEIKEIYYDKDLKPVAWGDAAIYGEDEEDICATFTLMSKAFKKPIIELDPDKETLREII